MNPLCWSVCAGAALIATTAPVAAYDADAVVFSDQVLKAALSDIAGMPEAELRGFTRYLS